MGLEATPISKPESLSFLIGKAATLVPVTVYLQVRSRNHSSVEEMKQIDLGFTTIHAWHQGHQDFDLGLSKRYSLDPRLVASRAILKKTPMPQYLAARQETIRAAIEINNNNLAEYESLQGSLGKKELSKLNERSVQLTNDLNLTISVAQTTGITLP